MKGVIAAAVVLMTAATCTLVSAAGGDSRPMVLVFEAVRGEGADKDVAAATTRAVRNYLRETGRVEATVLDRESPSVLRAVMEKRLTTDKLASFAGRADKLQVAGALGFQYAAEAEVSVKDVRVADVAPGLMKVVPETAGKDATQAAEAAGSVDQATRQVRIISVKLWVARVNGGKNSQWEGAGASRVGGSSSLDLENAVQSAASAAVVEVSRAAFAGLPRSAENAPAGGSETTLIGADQPPATRKPSAGDYAAQAEESIKAGNLALAIEQYKRAVNLDPTDGSLRVKLAETYARKGLYREAEDELTRARKAGADADMVGAAEERIQKMKSEASKDSAAAGTRVSMTGPSPRTAVPDAIAKMIEGDKLWKAGKPDEAAQAYKESIKLNPNDWRAHERLAVVNASMSLFGESKKALDELAKVQPNPPPGVLANRYEMLRGYFDAHFAALVKHYETAGADFEKKIITRESYYNIVKGLVFRLEAMAGFLDAVEAPVLKKPSHLHRSLACGLMAQAAASLLDYLETNAAKSKSNAAVFATQAKDEIQSAAKLEENKIVVEKEPAGTSASPEQPASPQPPVSEEPPSAEPHAEPPSP